MAKLEISLLGAFQVLLNGAPVTAFESVKVRALLAYLAAEYPRPHTRESLATLLWPDWPQKSAMSNLRYALADLRKVIGDRHAQPPFLVVTRSSLQLNQKADVWVDVMAFEQGIKDRGQGKGEKRDELSTIRDLQSSIALYRGSFLDGFSSPDSASFEEWLLGKREYLNQQMLKALNQLSEWMLEQGEYEQAEGYARNQIELEPWRERAYQQLMRALSLQGKRVQALAQFTSLKKALQRELKVEPSEDTLALYEQIRDNQLETPKKSVPEVRPEKIKRESPIELPFGTVTFLFTDVVGEVPIWERDPVTMKAALARYHAILNAAAEDHQGVAFKILGDEFQIAFEFTENALEAALQAQRALQAESWGDTGPLTVRMGLHTGPVEIIEGVLDTHDYAVSHTINRVACIRSSAHGGQILLSSATAELLHGYRSEAIHLRDLGEVYLKGMSIPERTYQVAVPDLPDSFPPLLSINYPNHNLPLQLTSFIGRGPEIEAVTHLLQANRLVTLTGPGGVGKTRLGLAVAGGLLKDFSDGVWLIELAPVTDANLVPTILTSTLGVQDNPGQTVLETLSRYFRGRETLLVLDNCEHLVDICAELIDTLLRDAPGLKMLITSRETLGLPGEITYRVTSLTFPPLEKAQDVGAAGQYEAVELFLDRARSVVTDYQLTSTNIASVVQICQRLDGIPLAIELAAARTASLEVAQIAERLDHAFRLLAGGSRAALERHRTLRATVDWSYNLLSAAERILLQRLSVFAGGWTLEAAEAVCVGDGVVEADVLNLLSQLVNKSMLIAERRPVSDMRYRMLETIRQYAADKIVDAGDSEHLRDRHLVYFVAFAERIEDGLRGPELVSRLNQLEAELDNFRLALDWGLQTDVLAELRLASALMWFWHIHSAHRIEGIAWLQQGLEAEAKTYATEDVEWVTQLDTEQIRVRAKALNAAGMNIMVQGRIQTAFPLLEESLTLFRRLEGDQRWWIAFVLLWQAYGYSLTADFSSAPPLIEQSLALFEELGDKNRIGDCLHFRSWHEKDPRQVLQLTLTMMEVQKESGDIDGIATAAQQLGHAYWGLRDLTQASYWFRESLEGYRQVGNRFGMANQLFNLARVIWFQGDYSQAERYMKQAADIRQEIGNREAQASGLLYLSLRIWFQDDYSQAERYMKQAADIYQEIGDIRLKIDCDIFRSQMFFSSGNYEAARGILESVFNLGQEINDPWLLAELSLIQAREDWLNGDITQAAQRLKAAQPVINQRDTIGGMITVQYLSGRLAIRNGDYSLAKRYYHDGLQHAIEHRPRTDIAFYLDSLASLAVLQSEMGRAACLFGSVAGIFPELPTTLSPIERGWREQDIQAARTALGEEHYQVVFEQGRGMSLDQAAAYALEETGKLEA